MAIRGQTRQVALGMTGRGYSTAYKDLDEAENYFPSDIDRRNGHMSDAGHWFKRPGFSLAYELDTKRAVELLIPEGPGYAVHKDGRITRLGRTPNTLSGRLTGSFRANWINSDGDILVVAGGNICVIDSGNITPVAEAPIGARWLGVLNAKVIAAGYSDTEWSWSDEGNNESWTASNFTNVEADGQKIRHFQVFKERLLFFKDHSIEVWDDVGSPETFARSFFIHKGTFAADSVVQANDTLFWFGDDVDFYGLDGTQQVVISKSIHQALMTLTKTDDCYGLVFRQETCIRWFFPTAGRCFVYDYYKQIWSEDNCWEHGQWTQLPIASAMEHDGVRYVGDSRDSGKVYYWSDQYKDDDGLPIRVYRDFSVRLSDEGTRAKINRAQFRIKRGVATDAEADPEFMVRYRIDRGPWGNTVNYKIGKKGDTDPYIDVYNLGVGREVEFELVETDATQWLVTDMNITSRAMGR